MGNSHVESVSINTESKNTKRFKTNKMTVFFILVSFAMAAMVLFSSHSKKTEFSTRNSLLYDAVVYVPGRVKEIVSESTSIGVHGIRIGSQYLRIEILKGELKGAEYEILNHLHVENSIWAKEGQILNIYLSYNLEDPSIYYAYVATVERSYINYIIISIFFILLCLVGGKTGIRSVFALVFTFVTIIFLLIPLIVREWQPVLATMDIAVSVSSSVNEISESNPDSSRKDLWRSSLIVGRDNAASMANTMILAFTGTFFITLVTYRITGSNYSAIINSSDIAIEIIRAVSATAALILAVPITSLVAVRIYRGK
ncbi:MAG: YibE/F family protein [Oscillospiraceae bacterium]|nr:YibE/F family protein [Oscillospiraceae bacterium]